MTHLFASSDTDLDSSVDEFRINNEKIRELQMERERLKESMMKYITNQEECFAPAPQESSTQQSLATPKKYKPKLPPPIDSQFHTLTKTTVDLSPMQKRNIKTVQKSPSKQQSQYSTKKTKLQEKPSTPSNENSSQYQTQKANKRPVQQQQVKYDRNYVPLRVGKDQLIREQETRLHQERLKQDTAKFQQILKTKKPVVDDTMYYSNHLWQNFILLRQLQKQAKLLQMKYEKEERDKSQDQCTHRPQVNKVSEQIVKQKFNNCKLEERQVIYQDEVNKRKMKTMINEQEQYESQRVKMSPMSRRIVRSITPRHNDNSFSQSRTQFY